MTYGVDQCRRCGVPIKTNEATAMREYEKSLKGKPTMSEAEWRRKGFLAMPTKYQMGVPQAGCCQPCGEKMVMRAMQPFKRIAKVGIGTAVAFTLIWIVANYVTH